jgi:hypothetical protein
MNPPQAALFQNAVGPCRKCPVGKIEILDGVTQLRFTFLVNHIDTLTKLGVACR